MKLLKITLTLLTFAIIAFAWYVTNDPATYHPLTDTLEVLPHSEISEYEVYGEMMMDESIHRNERIK